MEFIDYITGKGGIMIIGLIAVVVFVYRKYKEKHYFKDVEKRVQKRNQSH
jgi:hypothetical protein